MQPVFVDTSFYVAMLSQADRHHAAARQWLSCEKRTLVTTEYVLMETGNWLSSPSQRGVFANLLSHVQADARTAIVPASASLFESAAELFGQRLDKEWGMTDCASFVVMQQMSISEALSADRHFEQAGFRALLLHSMPV